MLQTEYINAALIATAIVFVFALYTDLSSKKIPNILCLITMLTGLTLQLIFQGISGLLVAFSGVVVALLVLFPAFAFKLLGAGDVKLMAAVGAFAGPKLILWAIAYGIVFGLFTSILIGLYHKGFSGFRETFKRYYHCFILRKYFSPGANEIAAIQVPYAPALALGWFWALSQNPDFQWVFSSLRYSMGI